MVSTGSPPVHRVPSRPGKGLFIPLSGRTFFLCLLLVSATVVIYWPVRGYPFSSLDDYLYVVNNVHVRGGLSWSTLEWALTHTYAANWHPLTWVSHAADIELFALDPGPPHLVNVLLHVIDALLLFWVLLRATGYVGRSWMVAALFALHPINVESVAWVAERKNMLSMLFLLLALAAYRWYAREPRVGRYSLVALLYVFGLMAKPQVITLPIVLLLWDYWPLRRMFATGLESSSGSQPSTTLPARSLAWLMLEKLPLMLVCAAGVLITLHAQERDFVTMPLQDRLRPENWVPKLSMRLGNAIVSYAKYIGKAFWPSALAPEYPLSSLTRWQILGALAVLVAITVLVIAGWRRRYLVTGWLWFLVTLVPMIGLIQAGRQAMADRYAYGSFLGLFIMICWGVAQWADQWHLPTAVLPGVSVIGLVALTAVTYRQVGYWKNDLTLWTHASQVVRNHWVAEDNIGIALRELGKSDGEVMLHFFRAAEVNPLDPLSNLNIAFYEQQHGNLYEAIAHYKNALIGLDTDTDKPKIYRNMGVAYRDLGDTAKARECFEKSVSLGRR